MRMILKSDGNVGIGTSSPSYKLDVNGTVQLQNDLIIPANNGAWNGTAGKGLYIRYSISGSQDSAYIQSINRSTLQYFNLRLQANNMYFGGGDGSERMTILANGNVGIGTSSPSYNLDIQGTQPTLRLLDTRSDGNAIISLKETNDNYGYDIAYIGANDNKMYIRAYNNSAVPRTDLTFERSTGNIGIGTSSPAYTLDVTGTIRATSDIYAFSDKRVKTNLQKVENAVSKIEKITGYTYNRIDKEYDTTKYTGLIAQEVQEVLPEAVTEDKNGYLCIAYGNMMSIIVEAIKELKNDICDIKKHLGI